MRTLSQPLSSTGSFIPELAPIWAHYPKLVLVGSPLSVLAHICEGPPASILPSLLHCPLQLALHSYCPSDDHMTCQSQCLILTSDPDTSLPPVGAIIRIRVPVAIFDHADS